MLIRSTPGAPLLALTFFQASVILALDTMYSTDAKSMGDGSITRLMFKSPAGVEWLAGLHLGFFQAVGHPSALAIG